MANPTLDLNAATHEEDPPVDPTTTTAKTLNPDIGTVDSKAAELQNGDMENKTTVAAVNSGGTDVEKKMRRAERFGITVHLSEEEKRNSRAQRFGTSSNGHPSDSESAEEQKKKARAERFGLPVPSTTSEEEAKKKARLDRFGSSSSKFVSSEEEERRKARAIRFSSSQSVSSMQKCGNEDVEPAHLNQKAAVAGNTAGDA